MLLNVNRKNHQDILRNARRTRELVANSTKNKGRAFDLPTLRADSTRLGLMNSIELKCAGMKLNVRDAKSVSKGRRRLTSRVSQIITLIKPIRTISPPTFSSLELKSMSYHPFGLLLDNPEETKCQTPKPDIPADKILLYQSAKSSELKESAAFCASLQRYVGLQAWEQKAIPKIDGLLETLGVCQLGNARKYHISEPYFGQSFRNLLSQFGKFEDCTARYFVRQLVKTTLKLHQLGFSHNRLNLDSIVHDCEGHLLINYFKASTKPVNEAERQNSMHYFSPEMLLSKFGHKSDKNDTWAIGCLALQFLSSKQVKGSKYHPYNRICLSESEFKSSILIERLLSNRGSSLERNNQPELPVDAVNFIEACLQPNERKRPSAEQLLAHSYIKE